MKWGGELRVEAAGDARPRKGALAQPVIGGEHCFASRPSPCSHAVAGGDFEI